MGSEQIHFEALRKQMIMDRRNAMNIQKKVRIICIMRRLAYYTLKF
jgi:hypothetical protein